MPQFKDEVRGWDTWALRKAVIFQNARQRCLIYTGGWVAVSLEHWAEPWVVGSEGRLSHNYWWWKEEGAHKTVILLLQYVSKVVHIFLKSFPQTELEYCCPPQKQKHLSSSALPYLQHYQPITILLYLMTRIFLTALGYFIKIFGLVWL